MTIPGVGTNRYAYAGNDPINKSDPSGHQISEMMLGDEDERDEIHSREALVTELEAWEQLEDDNIVGANELSDASAQHLAMIGRSNRDLIAAAIFGAAVDYTAGRVSSGAAKALGDLVGLGPYAAVGGHHVYSKRAFQGVAAYNEKQALSIGQEFMDARGWQHSRMTAHQRTSYTEFRRRGDVPTVRDHTAIAVAALERAGATTVEARAIVAVGIKGPQTAGDNEQCDNQCVETIGRENG